MLVGVRVPLTANLGIHMAVDHYRQDGHDDYEDVGDRGQEPEVFGPELRLVSVTL